MPVDPGAGDRKSGGGPPAGSRGRPAALAAMPDSVRLVAVSKMFPAAAVRAAAAAGQVDFGENKVQDGLQKIADTSGLPLRWHLVGHLQSNKARRAAAVFQAIHSIDSVELLRRVDAAAAETGTTPELLVQVDLAGEATKFGVPESAVQAVFETDLRAARLTGLMLLPPEADNPEDARPWFQRLRELRDRLASAGIPGRSPARALDGHEPRFRGGGPGRLHDRPDRHRYLRAAHARTRPGDHAVTATPLDLRTQQFKTSIRGFDRRDVSEFVASLATRYDEVLREADRLRDDLGRTQALVEEHREQERNLRATLMTAQKLADEIRLTAEQESQRIIGEAQARAAALVQGDSAAPRGAGT